MMKRGGWRIVLHAKRKREEDAEQWPILHLIWEFLP